ncbi:hypothetical protein [Salinarimonas rosea]|uniref:hypothetical protein n=1 Tax=Salinarimonas rosea TaxID=552063 RepID=UPI00040109FD|nr:hypothetical protein [Salinarimonas rosea]
MAGLLGAFANRFGRARPPRAALDRVAALAREALALPEDATLAVNEIVCADPACPGTETVILVMIPGTRTRAIKVVGEADAVTEAALRAAADDACAARGAG